MRDADVPQYRERQAEVVVTSGELARRPALVQTPTWVHVHVDLLLPYVACLCGRWYCTALFC